MSDEPSPTATLIEHSFDFIESALDVLEKTDPSDRDARLSVVLLAMGVELILKARLVENHWSLVFDKIDDADRKRFQKGNFKSVGPEQSISRVEQICEVPLSKKFTEAMAELRRVRNQVVHFPVHFETLALRARASSALDGFRWFVTQLPLSSFGLHRRFETLELRILKLSDYVSMRSAEIADAVRELPEGGYPCPACRQRAVDATDGASQCLFCGKDHYP